MALSHMKITHKHTMHTRVCVHARAVRHLFELGDKETVHVVHVRVEATRVHDGRVKATVAELARARKEEGKEGSDDRGKDKRWKHDEIWPRTSRGTEDDERYS